MEEVVVALLLEIMDCRVLMDMMVLARVVVAARMLLTMVLEPVHLRLLLEEEEVLMVMVETVMWLQQTQLLRTLYMQEAENMVAKSRRITISVIQRILQMVVLAELPPMELLRPMA